jgi:hypothetical protein
LQQAIAKSPWHKGSVEDWLILTLAHHRFGHKEEAKKCLAQAAQLMEQIQDLSGGKRLDQLILRREAETLINKPPQETTPTQPKRQPERERKPKS